MRASDYFISNVFVAISGLRIMVFLLQNRVIEKPNAPHFEDFGDLCWSSFGVLSDGLCLF